ncbi:PAS domain-containing protein [Aquimarina latercula]|uniref:PAS domain-containing protein n=1 Tax=Aquimarina latercula TaxID=987 RepID=UPI000402AB54|nr:PAS domain S-box protein [Aquimarina latercula]
MAYSEETTSRDFIPLNENFLKEKLYQLIKKEDKIFDFIQDSVWDGLWFWDLKKPKNEWVNKNFWDTLGYNPKQMPDKISSWRDVIKDEDLKKISDNLENYSYHLSDSYEQVLRYTHKLGHIVWLQFNGLIIKDDDGKPTQMLGIHTDLSKLKRTEEKLQELVEKYEDVLEGPNQGSWEWNLRTGEVLFDEQWANIIGYSLAELQPISLDTWVSFMHPSDHIKTTKILQEHYEKRIPYYECEIRLKHKNGEWIWALVKGKIISWDKEDNPEWLVGSQVDITDNKKALEKNRLFVSQAPSAMAMFDTNMRYLAASRRWFEDYNIVGQNIIGKTQYEVFPEMEEKWNEYYKECLTGNVLRKEEDCLKGKEGCLQWISWELRPWYNREGKIAGVLMHTSDISKLKKAEAINEERKVFLEAILDSVNVGIVSCDQNGKLTLFNNATKKWHGLPVRSIPITELSQHYGLYKRDGVTPLKEEEIPLLKALKGEEVKDQELTIIPKIGPIRKVVTNGSQLIGADGEIKGAVVAMHDVTERKMAEDKLKVSEEAFRGNFENAAIGMAIIGLDGRWIEVNNAVCNMIGYSKEKLTKMTFQDITHPDDLKKDLGLLNKLLKDEIPYYHLEKRYIHKNGQEVYTLLSVSLVKDKNQKPLYFISQITDTTQNINTRRKLHKALAKLEGVLESSTRVAIIGTNTSGIINIFNKGAENLLGYSRDELLLKESPIIIHLKDEIKMAEIELSTELGEYKEGFKVFIELANKEKYYTREWTLVRKDGTQFPVQLTITAIKEKGNIIGYLGVATDISDIKKAKRELKSILKVTENQNTRLKDFAHIVSHKLQLHSSNLERLLEKFFQENPEAKESEVIKMFKITSSKLSDTIKDLNDVVKINNSINTNLD